MATGVTVTLVRYATNAATLLGMAFSHMPFMAISCTPEADAVLTADKIAEQTRGDVRPFIIPAFQDEDGLDETRIMNIIYSLVMPYLHSPQTYVAVVSNERIIDAVLKGLLCMEGTSVHHQEPSSAKRSMSIYTKPLLPGAYHQVHVSVHDEQIHARICTLSESAHLQHPTPSLMSIDKPSSTLPSPVSISFPSDTSPEAAVSPGRDTLVLSRPDPHRSTPLSISPLRLRSVDTFMHSREGTPRLLSQTPKNAQSYDMLTMMRSIEKWDPMVDPLSSTPLDMLDSATTAGFSPLGLGARFLDTPSSASRGALSVRSMPASAVPLRSSNTPTPHATSHGHNGSASSVTNTSTLSGNVSAFAQSLFNYLPSPVAAIGGHNSGPTSAAPDPQSLLQLWQRICICVLPIFVQEPHNLLIEPLHDSVDLYVRLVHERDQVHARATLLSHFEKLVSTGLHGVTFQLQQNDGSRLLYDFLRAWQHYYGTVMPFLHACFSPLESRLWSMDLLLARWLQRHDPLTHIDPSHAPARIDLRHALLILFRDLIVLPICDWLYMTTVQMQYTIHTDPSNALNTSVRGRLMQLVNIMNSLGTDDAAQQRIERLRRGLLSHGLSLHSHTPPTSTSILDVMSPSNASTQPSPISPIPSCPIFSTPNSPTIRSSH